MHAFLAVVAASVIGIDVGWKPLEDGGVEYIVQIHPDQVERIANSEDLLSDVPKGLDVRRYRITVGTDPLPRDMGLLTASKDESPAASEKVEAEEAVPSTVVRKEVVAEGSIPVSPATEASPEAPVVEIPAEAHASKASTTDSESPVVEHDEEGPAFPVETTVHKPATGPAPIDEESVQEEGDYRRPQPIASPPRTSLLDSSNNTPPRSRLFDNPPEDVAPALPGNNRGRGHVDQENVRGREYATEYGERPRESRRLVSNTESPRSSDVSEGRELRSYDRASQGQENQWGPLAFIFLLLMLSMGGNFWLGWIAFEARQRYQLLLDKYRTVGGRPTVDLV